jgi:hypothetical protein
MSLFFPSQRKQIAELKLCTKKQAPEDRRLIALFDFSWVIKVFEGLPF